MATDTTDLATIDEHDGGMIVAEPFSPTEARAHAIADTLTAAYAKASKIKLTKEESEKLVAPFPDAAFRRGAGGDDDLIYIEHAYLRQRIDETIGIGQSAAVRRREWSEHFTYEKYGKKAEGVRVYVDLVMVIRGCFVSEAIGDGTYYPANAKTTFSDAVESAESNAYRRCCKKFGIGLQAWMKGWQDQWKDREAAALKTRADAEHAARQDAARLRASEKANGHAPAKAEPEKTPPPVADKRTPSDLVSEAASHFGDELGQYDRIKTSWLKTIAANQCDAKRSKANEFVVDQLNKGALTQAEHDALLGLIVDGTPLPDDPNAQLPPVEPARGAQEDSHIRALVANGEFDEAAAHLEQSISSGAIRGEQSSALHNLIEAGRKNAEKGGFVTA